MQRHRQHGYNVHLVKVEGDVAKDIACIRHVEAIRDPDESVLYDLNRARTRQQTQRVMTATADFDVMFEHPDETLDDIAAKDGPNTKTLLSGQVRRCSTSVSLTARSPTTSPPVLTIRQSQSCTPGLFMTALIWALMRWLLVFFTVWAWGIVCAGFGACG